MEISVVNSYSGDKSMHTISDNLYQGVKYSDQIEIHKAYLRREENFVYQKSLSISALKIDYLNLENSVRNTERANFLNQG